MAGAPSDKEDSKDDEEQDDAPGGPRVECATPLEGEEKGDYPGDEEDSSENIEFEQELTGRRAGCVGVGREVDQEDNDDSRYGTKGEVDPETPSYPFSKQYTRMKGQTHSSSADPSKPPREWVQQSGRYLQPPLRRRYISVVCPLE